MRKPKLLVIEHEAQCPPAWLGEWLAEAGAELDVRRPYRGDPLPADLDAHDGFVVLGGAMDASADATHPWLTRTKDLLRVAAGDGTPALGVCLGHQLAAVALGGAAGPNPEGQQLGVLEIGWRPAAGDDPLFAPLATPRRGVQWNDDVVTALPEGAVVLAETGRGENQAARFAPSVWGVQWHPEVSAEIIGSWAENDRDRAHERGIDIDEYVDQVAAARDELRAAWRGLATGFLELAHDRAPTA